MSSKPLFRAIAATLLCAALPAGAQPEPSAFPDGPGKATHVRELPRAAELVIMRRPIAGG